MKPTFRHRRPKANLHMIYRKATEKSPLRGRARVRWPPNPHSAFRPLISAFSFLNFSFSLGLPSHFSFQLSAFCFSLGPLSQFQLWGCPSDSTKARPQHILLRSSGVVCPTGWGWLSEGDTPIQLFGMAPPPPDFRPWTLDFGPWTLDSRLLPSALSSAPHRRQEPHRQSSRIDGGGRKLSRWSLAFRAGRNHA
jgi:hypothetical protein